jgi:hypothetical protein
MPAAGAIGAACGHSQNNKEAECLKRRLMRPAGIYDGLGRFAVCAVCAVWPVWPVWFSVLVAL